ncbi:MULTISPECIES: DNA-directed DNA polymerase [Methanobacterium]|jgi:DNA polymerase I|uniref:DNA polymerase n=1 Tax=Methanobacterium subterraneum TaxID=59277 RepID=A0A7K4DMR7_9EURY|nr:MULTISPECIES: DNA-directed DNA polymerase [Methanobacterium]AUB57596.1 DNA polymerase [Methanobacterium sp. MZ-A1]MCC7559677.1 DNA-directed DNA polymerase [Methanobacterium sp.]NMO09326.1 DNA polymerase [Methanobacterium subterraneum]
MEIKRMVLLDIDYITRGDKAVVRLFGREKSDGEGNSIIVLDYGFKPYIYVDPHNLEQCHEQLDDLDLVQIEKVEMKDLGKCKEFLKVTFNHPQDVPKLRDKIRDLSQVKEIREHDIPFYRRYLIDKGLFPMAEVEVEVKKASPEICSIPEDIGTSVMELSGQIQPFSSDFPDLKILSLDIEVYNPKGMPNAEDDPIIMISLSSNHGLRKVISTVESPLDFMERVEDEKQMLERFVAIIEEENPDILIGYNSDNFDFPYIRDRAAILDVPLTIGTDGSSLKFMKRGFANAALVKGRVHVDLYLIMRRYLQLDRYTLERVYLELFDEEKYDIPGDEIHQYWDDCGSKLEKLCNYSLDDAVAVTKIGEKMIPLTLELTRIVGQPFFDVARMATGQQVEWYLIRKAHEQGEVVPNKPSSSQYSNRRGKRAAGGYVKDPVKGLHENIVYFDFRSLYPSIIISKNVSPDTLVDECNPEDCHISPEGGYMFLKEPAGFVPSIIGNILNERVRLKTLMKESKDDEEKKILNVQQEALKRLANSMYGVYGYSRFRWYRLECADAITAWGRDYIKKTMVKAEKFGFKPVYADTDGFYAVYDENIT